MHKICINCFDIRLFKNYKKFKLDSNNVTKSSTITNLTKQYEF